MEHITAEYDALAAARHYFARVHWARLIADEGHVLGDAYDLTALKLSLATLAVDRRWIMTGTPAPAAP
eukprot:contig_44330_g9879